MTPHFPHGLSVVEKFCASVSLDCCIIPDEMELKQLEVNFCIAAPSLVIFTFLGKGWGTEFPLLIQIQKMDSFRAVLPVNLMLVACQLL